MVNHNPRVTFTEISGVNNSVFGKSQVPIRQIITHRAEAYENESIADKIFTHHKSDRFGEKTTSMTAMYGMRPVGEMGAHPWDGMQEGFSKIFEHTVWKDSFSISREMIDDSRVEIMKNHVNAFMDAYGRGREKFAAALFGTAMNGANHVIDNTVFDTHSADGEFLFSTSHKLAMSANTITNKFSDPFSRDALGRIGTYMSNVTDDNGNILSVSPDTIIIPNNWDIISAVFDALGSERPNGNANNGYYPLAGGLNIAVWSYLNEYATGDNIPWILMDSRYNETYEGAVWFDRVQLEMKSRVDWDTDANVWNAYERWGAGFNDFRAFAVGGVSGGTALSDL